VTATKDDPLDSALDAGLRYVSDEQPGIRRRRCGRGFTYVEAENRRVREAKTLARIRALAIPPAWTDVWICANPRGHLQATGRDARGRKQYRYHSEWRALRDRKKFDRLPEFGAALPRLRRRVARDLRLRGLPRERVLAAVVRLLERSLIRVGNDEYARDNGSYGLTTLLRRHVGVNGSCVRFEFEAKSGRRWVTEVDDRRLGRTIRRCQEIRGQKLFTYLDSDGSPRDVDSGCVNDYLRSSTGEAFSAKDFRTWAGTVQAAALLRRSCEEDVERADAERRVVEVVGEVASLLGNTPAICRKSYVHPGLLDSFLDGRLCNRARKGVPPGPRGLAADERFTLALLRGLRRATRGGQA
jgi:DNA topoisomerase-1